MILKFIFGESGKDIQRDNRDLLRDFINQLQEGFGNIETQEIEVEARINTDVDMGEVQSEVEEQASQIQEVIENLNGTETEDAEINVNANVEEAESTLNEVEEQANQVQEVLNNLNGNEETDAEINISTNVEEAEGALNELEGQVDQVREAMENNIETTLADNEVTEQSIATNQAEVLSNRAVEQSELSEAAATDADTVATAGNMAATQGQTSADTQQLMVTAGLITAEELEAGATVQASLADIQLAINSRKVTLAQGQQIATTLGLDAAQLKAAKSTTLLSKALNFLKANVALLIIAGFAALITHLKHVAVSIEEATEKFNTQKEKLKEYKSELDAVSEKLSDAKERIDELNRLKVNDEITASQLDELSILQQQTKEYETQYELLNAMYESQKANAQAAAAELINYRKEMEEIQGDWKFKTATTAIDLLGFNLFEAVSSVGGNFDNPVSNFFGNSGIGTVNPVQSTLAVAESVTGLFGDNPVTNAIGAVREYTTGELLLDAAIEKDSDEIRAYKTTDKKISEYEDLQKELNDLYDEVDSASGDKDKISKIKDKIVDKKSEIGDTSSELASRYQENIDILELYKSDKRSEEAFEDDIKDLEEENKKIEFLLNTIDLENSAIDKIKEYVSNKADNDGITTEDLEGILKTDEDWKFAAEIFKSGISFPNVKEFIHHFNDYKAAIEKESENVDVSIPVNTTFKTIINESKYAEIKDELLELAKSGELTAEELSKKALSDDDYKEFMSDLEGIGISANEAKTEILGMLDSTEKLSGAAQSISGLKDAYTEFKKKNYVTAEAIESIPDAFKKLETYDFDLFKKIVGDPKSGYTEIQNAFNEIVTAYIKEQGTLEKLTEHDKARFISNLKEMGITNAEEVVSGVLAIKDNIKDVANEAEPDVEKINNFLTYMGKEAVTSSNDLAECTWDEVEALMNVSAYYGFSSDKIKEYVAKKIWANQNNLEESGDIAQLLVIAKSAGIATDALYEYEKAKDMHKDGYGGGQAWLDAMQKKAYDELLKEIEKLYNFEMPEIKVEDLDVDPDSDSTFDWVEIAVTRAEEELDRLNTAVDNTYSNWTKRSNALKEAIKDTNYAIGLQRQAYDTYMTKANSVNLAPEIKELVKNGDMWIQDHVGSGTKELIDEYLEWYNKALDAKKAQEELNQTLNELETTKQVDMIEEYYDGLTEAKENGIEKLQNKIDMAETQGFFANNSYYEGIDSILDEEIKIVEQKKANLDKVLADNANLKGTAAYTELENLVASVSNELDELYIKIEENKNSAQENEWNYFDYLRESISRVIDEADYLIELLSDEDLFDDSGNMTKYADATLALHGSNYEVYMANAKEYAEEVKALEKDLAEGKDVIDRYNEMVDAHQDAVLAAQKEKQAILDLVEEGYKAQLDALNELIDKKKEAMNAEKDLYDYQKSIEEKTQARDSLRRQLEVYKNDTSEEGLAQAQKLSVELKKAEDDLAETEYEKMLSDQQAMLDALSEDYELWMNERLDNEDALLKEIRDKLPTGEEIKATLTEVAGQYGSTLSTELKTVFGEKPFDGVATAINKLIEKIDGYVGGDPGDSKTSGGTNSGGGSGSGGGTNGGNVTNNTKKDTNTNKDTNTDKQTEKSKKYTFIDKKSSYDKNKLAKETSIVDRLKYYDKDSSWDARAKYYSDLGGSGTYTGSATQNKWLISKMKENGFAKGGTIGNLIKRTGEDGFVLARTGEEILSLEKIEALRDIFEKINPAMPNLNLTKVPAIQRRDVAQNVNLGGITIEQVVANNPQEFVQQLKTVMSRDLNVQKMVQEISFGQGLGNNTMNVKKYM